MRIVVVGAGMVGRAIAHELASNNHDVLVIDKEANEEQASALPAASWLFADACEYETLVECGLEDADVVVSTTGDDKANLTVCLLAKTEFGVPRTVARVNDISNEWLFGDNWGVDVAVSTPRLMTALVEEAVNVGALVRLFAFEQGRCTLAVITLPEDNQLIGSRVAELDLPAETALVALLRDGIPTPPQANDVFEPLDELMFLTTQESEASLAKLIANEETWPGHIEGLV